MRCPACRVDLNEDTHRCPLCHGKAEDTPPAIEGVAFQSYPKIEYTRFQRNVSMIWFGAGAILFLLAAAAELLLTHQLYYAPYLAILTPSLWALLIRPKMNVNLSLGNFMLGAMAFLSALLFWFGHLHQQRLTSTLASGGAILTLAATLVLLADTIFRRQHRERHLVFMLMFATLAAVEFGVAFREGTVHIALSASALGLSLISLLLLWILCGKAIVEELKSRFHF